MNEPIYLDNHTETKLCRAAIECWNSLPLSSQTDFLYDLVNAQKEDLFFFTSSGAEAIQQVYWSVFLEVSRKEGKCHFLTTNLEDASTLLGMKRLEELGCFIKTANYCDLTNLINPRTALVSISLAQGLTGIIHPLEEISKICKEKGVLLHVDVTYAVGKLPLNLDLADYLTFSGDRMHGPKSSGALFAKAGKPLVPLILGKTIDYASLAALNAAAQQAKLSMMRMGLEIARLRNRFEQAILEEVPGSSLLFSDPLRLPNVALLSFPLFHQEALLYALRKKNIQATIGGTVHSHLHRLLTAAGCNERIGASTISFALSRYTTSEEIEEAIKRTIEAARSLEPCASHL